MTRWWNKFYGGPNIFQRVLKVIVVVVVESSLLGMWPLLASILVRVTFVITNQSYSAASASARAPASAPNHTPAPDPAPVPTLAPALAPAPAPTI